MKMNPPGLDTMDFSFRFSQPPKYCDRSFLNRVGDPRGINDLFNINEMAVLFLVRYRNIRMDGCDAGPVDVAEFDPEFSRRNTVKLSLQLTPIDPERGKPTEYHVAANTGETIKIKRSHEIESIPERSGWWSVPGGRSDAALPP